MHRTSLRPFRLAALIGFLVLLLLAFSLVEPRVGRLWLNSAYLAVAANLIALPLGVCIALIVVKSNTPGRWAAAVLLAGMLFVPLFLFTGAWDAGFGLQGWLTLSTNPHLAEQPWLSGWRAAVWVHGMAAVPWVATIVAAGLRAVEAALEEEASLFARPAQVLWHVTLRRAAPAIAFAGLWVAIVASIEISVTDFFQVRTFAEEVYTQSALGAFNSSPQDIGAAAATAAPPAAAPSAEAEPLFPAAGLWFGLAFTTLLAVVALAFGGKWLVQIGHVPPHQQWSWRLGPARWLAAALLWVTMLIVAGVPLGNMIYKAGMHTIQTDAGRVRTWSLIQTLQRVASAPIEYAADFELSAAIGAAAATAAVFAGLPLAWSLRGPQRTLSFVILCFLALCLTIPGPLLGIGLIHILNRPPSSPLAFLAVLYDSHFAPWLVQTIRALPLVTLVLWTALAGIPQATLEAAALDGAGWWSSLLRIAIPERWPAIVAAWLVGFAIACGELPATVLVMPPGRSGLPIHVFQLLHYGMDDRVAAISLVMVGATSLLGAAAAIFLVAARRMS